MSWNVYRPRGAVKGNEPTSGGAVVQSVPKFAIVKDNIDPLRCGRLRVYVEGMSGLDPDNADSWVTVQYMSTYYGQTLSTSPNTGEGTYKTNTHSYGMWSPAPDIGTTVIVIFVNGDPNFGVWIGAVPEPATLQMVPAIGASIPDVKVVLNKAEAESFGGATRLPAVNINSNNDSFMKNPNLIFQPRPVHSYVAGILFQQGLIRDPLRGVISSSAQRETPSRVMGISTPGRPNYAGGYTDESIAKTVTSTGTPPENLKIISRRGGHSLVMDDGNLIGQDQLIRLRTAMGHQILMSDDGQCLFIIHSNGKSWIELGKEGTIDMFSTNSVNIRTAGDLNLHADNNINMFAKKSINMSTETFTTESAKDTNVRVGGNFAQQVVGKYTVKVGGAMSMASAGEGSYYSDATMYINGKIINLNSGKASTVPQKVKPIPVVMHTDTLFDKGKGWLAAPGKLPSIVSRAPAHTPWDAAGSGVPVKVELNAENALPSSSSPSVAAASNAAATQSAGPQATATPATTATVPKGNPVSKAIDGPTTAAAISAQAAAAVTGPAAQAAAAGGGVTQMDGVVVPTVGQLGITPPQAEAAGYIKPGAAAAQAALANKGLPAEKVNSPNFFTGVPGGETFQQLANNVNAQVNAVVKNLQSAQAGLTAAGVITGKENGAAILGTVMAAATNGVQNTVNFIKNAATNVAGAAVGAINNAVGGAVNAVSSAASKVLGGVSAVMNLGNKAGAIAGALGGGMSALSASVSNMAAGFGKTASDLFESAKGQAAGAFNALKASLPTLKAGVPIDVKKIAEAAAGKAQGSATDLLNDGMKKLTDGASAATKAIDDAKSIASGASSAAAGAVTALTSAVSTAAGAATSTVNQVVGTAQQAGLNASKLISSASGVASGLNLIPGGVPSVMPQANNLGQTFNNLGKSATDTMQSLSTNLNTGLNSITNTINGTKSAITSATDLLSNGIPKFGGDPAAAVNGALDSAKNAVGSLTDKIAGAGGGLKGLALKGLPAPASGQLQSAIAGLAGGDTKVSLPITAVNTSDFGAATDEALASLMGAGISPPNFNGNPATMGESEAAKLLEKTTALNADITKTVSDIANNASSLTNTQTLLDSAKANLPEGAPQIDALKQKLDGVVGDGIKLQQNANNILNGASTLAGQIKKFP